MTYHSLSCHTIESALKDPCRNGCGGKRLKARRGGGSGVYRGRTVKRATWGSRCVQRRMGVAAKCWMEGVDFLLGEASVLQYTAAMTGTPLSSGCVLMIESAAATSTTGNNDGDGAASTFAAAAAATALRGRGGGRGSGRSGHTGECTSAATRKGAAIRKGAATPAAATSTTGDGNDAGQNHSALRSPATPRIGAGASRGRGRGRGRGLGPDAGRGDASTAVPGRTDTHVQY
ncbi:hypothetical protein GQ600_1270 [Phytophthora cactorum]|nr:hypothetical protein GQ600_1270 [Phytophthora cactorum]